MATVRRQLMSLQLHGRSLVFIKLLFETDDQCTEANGPARRFATSLIWSRLKQPVIDPATSMLARESVLYLFA